MPYLALIKLLLDVILVLLDLFLLLLELVELIILHVDVDCHEDKLVTQISHALYPSDSSFGVRYPSSLVASSRQLRLLSRLEHACDLGKHAQVANYLADVSRLAFLSKLVP